jgi:hypothetical protein
MRSRKKIRVTYTRLVDKWGEGDKDQVWLDKSLKGKKHMEILLHECLHHLFYELSEEEVVEKSILLANTMWYQGYRRVDNTNSEPLQDGTK